MLEVFAEEKEREREGVRVEIGSYLDFERGDHQSDSWHRRYRTFHRYIQQRDTCPSGRRPRPALDRLDGASYTVAECDAHRFLSL